MSCDRRMCRINHTDWPNPDHVSSAEPQIGASAPSIHMEGHWERSSSPKGNESTLTNRRRNIYMECRTISYIVHRLPMTAWGQLGWPPHLSAADTHVTVLYPGPLNTPVRSKRWMRREMRLTFCTLKITTRRNYPFVNSFAPAPACPGQLWLSWVTERPRLHPQGLHREQSLF